MFELQDKIPDKGKDIIGYDYKDNKYYCFRCNCGNDKCLEFRCSITGSELIINIIKWKYE